MIVEGNELKILNKYGLCHRRTGEVDSISKNHAEQVLDEFIGEHTVQPVNSDTCIKRVIERESKFQQVQVVYSEKFEMFIAQFYDAEFTLMGSKGTGCRSYRDAEKWIRENYKVVRGLKVNVLRNLSWSDCTNGGISAKRDELYLISPQGSSAGPEDLRECVSLGCIAVEVKKYLHVKPVFFPDRWYSHGGNFLFTGNSVYREVTGISYPIPIHDRYEGKSGTKLETVNVFNQASEE